MSVRKPVPVWVWVVLGLVVGIGYVGYYLLAADLPHPEALITRQSPSSTKIYDRKGRLLFEVLDPRAGRRTRVPLDELPLHLRQAVIAVEDANFYAHPGVDARGIIRALWQMGTERRIVSGGSTITQQLAREVLLSEDERRQRTLARKLREAILALRIERHFTKDQILEMYLNEVYFGQLAYGVEAAARAYFDKPARDLDLAEAALLAGLIQSPARYNPLVHPDAAKKRQAVVLDLMVKAGFITREQAELAKHEPLHFAGGQVEMRAPHFVTYARNLLEAKLGAERVNYGGLEVITTLDLDLQTQAEAIVRRHLARLQDHRAGEPDRNVHNAALVALDPGTGEILAMVGSPDYFDARIDGAVNAALALRQPGSAIKPITYAAAFERGLTPATVLSDVPTAFLTKEGEPYQPQNYDRAWHGPISLRRALATSSNMIAVKVLDRIGVDALMEMAHRLGITTFEDRERFGLALTLGGGEVRLLELTAAYGAFANGGFRVEPVAILEVRGSTNSELEILNRNINASTASTRVLNPRVAYLITDILSDDQARMPAFGENSVLKLTRPAAAKTGTTSDWRDNWTIGYTPDLVVGVWVGNADNSPMRYVSGITGAGPIWHDFMEEALKGKPVRNFQRPAGVVEVEVCEASGLLPTEHCPRRKREVFIAGTEPTEYDNSYQAFQIDATTGLLWEEGCQGPQVEQVYRILPLDARDWGRKQGIPEPPTRSCMDALVAHGQDLKTAGWKTENGERRTQALVITHPAPNSTFALSPELPASAQRIEITARPAGSIPLRQVTLLVDGRPLATLTRPPYRTLWQLEEGTHEVRAVGVDAEGQRLESQPLQFTVMEAPRPG